MNTSNSPSHIPTIFSFGPSVAKCEQHAYPKAAAFLSCMLEIIDLIAMGNVFHIHTHKSEVGNLGVLQARLLFHCFCLKAKMMPVTIL